MLEVLNSVTNKILIDSEHACHALRAKFSVTSTAASWTTTGRGQVTVNAGVSGLGYPVFATESANGVAMTQQIGAQATFVTENVGDTVDVYVYGRPRLDSTYGIQVFDENEQIVFDALEKYLKVKQFFNYEAGNFPGFTGVSGRRYAALWSQPAVFKNIVFTGGAFNQEIIYAEMVKAKNATVSAEISVLVQRNDPYAQPIGPRGNRVAGFGVIDVTGQ